MSSSARRLCALVAVVVLVAGACGDSGTGGSGESGGSGSGPAAQGSGNGKPGGGGKATRSVLDVTVADGSISGTDGIETVSVGDEVTIAVTSDVADEIHLHGYDKKVDVAAGGTAKLRFTADIPGEFEVELEDAGLPLFELVVQ